MSHYENTLHFNDRYVDGGRKGKFNDENDEGIFVFESNGEEEDDYEYEMFHGEPKTEFEKNLSKIENITRQIEDDTQMLGHELKTIEVKNESTERRILKLMRDAAEFRAKLKGFLGSYTPGQRYGGNGEKRQRYGGNIEERHRYGGNIEQRHRYGGNVEEIILPTKEEDSLEALPSFHTASLKVLLKQNSIEQPVHVNIAVDESGSYNVY